MSTPTTNPIGISIPAGKAVIVNFATNASFSQSFSITNSSGVVECSGSGSGVGPAVQTSQVFTAELGGTYSVVIDGNSSAEKVLTADCSAIDNGVIYAQSYIFAGEDSTDDDYNDTFLSISWFQFNG